MNIRSLCFRFVLCSLFAGLLLISDVKAESPAISTETANAAWIPPANEDVCWGSGGNIIRLRFKSAGGGYYQVVGNMIESSSVIGALFGSAVKTSSTILVTATWSGANSKEAWFETGRFSINRKSVKLTGYGAGMEHKFSISESAEPYAGGKHTFPKIPCP